MTQRLEFVDALRGFALFGVCAANLFIFSGLGFMTDAQQAPLLASAPDKAAWWFEQVLIENKFMGLFACLFGVSFWLFLESALARGLAGKRLFYARVFWLLVIGMVHGWLLWCFDILRFYALWGMLLPLFLRVPRKRLLSSALFCALLAPALVSGLRSLCSTAAAPDSSLDALALSTFSSGSLAEFLRVNWRYDWYLTISVGQIAYQVAVFGRLLLGLFAARTLMSADLQARRSALLKLVWIGAIVGLAGNVLVAGHWLEASSPGNFLAPFTSRMITELGFLGLDVAYAAGLGLLFFHVRWRRLLSLLAPVGRTALTCYLLQTLFGLWLFYGFMPGPQLMGKLGPAMLLAIAVAEYSLQLVIATLWLRHFRFGPAEWLWRSLTYGKLQPFRLAAASAR